ncbi:hypothetical protein PIB30_011831 [Stylosanthes scabra]|uniref:Uncharacterized protein n=1 Tax=Stylosanthes scabra TaxID=79078 RepID=A0ABU6S7C2_9FABA|nr:hypothetical protein [Stylosanthes scabra]
MLDTTGISGAYAFKVRCPIEEWDQDQLDDFREHFVSKVLMSEYNTLNVEAINQAQGMTLEVIAEARTKMGRRTKPSVALRSPYLQLSSAKLEKKH